MERAGAVGIIAVPPEIATALAMAAAGSTRSAAAYLFLGVLM
jgi:hypothetical protein